MSAIVLKDTKSGSEPVKPKRVITWVGAGCAIAAQADDKFQFERHGYFMADRKDHGAGKVVFNKITDLKDTWVR